MTSGLLRSPGVYQPKGDTHLLEEVLRADGATARARVLDVGTGTGALALAAARAGARSVTAVDVSARAVLVARLNAWIRWLPVEAQRIGSLDELDASRFDLVVSNPPYVPSAADAPPRSGAARAWDAGPDGRAVLDALCTAAPDLLQPGGSILIVQSNLSGVGETITGLEAAGLDVSIAARRTQSFGPVLRERSSYLERRGLLPPGKREEELVVIRGDRS